MEPLNLNNLREQLIRQEETIIFAMIERAQFKQNRAIYQVGSIPIANHSGSFLDYLLRETEAIHSRVRRYTSPDEHPFFENLPEPVLPLIDYPHLIQPNCININSKICNIYMNEIIPVICSSGDDENYGSSATCDVSCLQALSKRIHYGKFIAECKYQEKPDLYQGLIRDGDSDGILKTLTNKELELILLKRVKMKTATYGQDIGVDSARMNYKINPETIAEIYEKWLIPLTKEVEIQYFLTDRTQNGVTDKHI